MPAAYVPAAHAVQVLAAVPAAYVPAAHAVQAEVVPMVASELPALYAVE